MDPVDYWPMVRGYSLWNAAIAALQFWTADLKARILSSAIEQVYNAFFYSLSMYLLHQQSDEILFGPSMTTLNATFGSKLALEDEGYESGSEILTYQLHLEHPRFITFPVPRMCPLTLTQSHHTSQVPRINNADWYADA